jgi:hypothetical protein
MIGKTVILEENTPIYVTLSADGKGQVSIGIRVNGSDQCLMGYAVTLPQPGCSQTWSKNIGDIM